MDAISAIVLGHPLWAWLTLAAVFLTFEVITGSGWLLWPAGSAAAVALLSAVAPLGILAEIPIFAALTIVTTYLGRRFLVRPNQGGHDVNDTAARLIGRHGRATATFTDGRGRVFVDGKEWSAESEVIVTAGVSVEVVALLGGARLKVRPG